MAARYSNRLSETFIDCAHPLNKCRLHSSFGYADAEKEFAARRKRESFRRPRSMSSAFGQQVTRLGGQKRKRDPSRFTPVKPEGAIIPGVHGFKSGGPANQINLAMVRSGLLARPTSSYAWVEGKHADDRGPAVAQEFTSLHDVYRRCAVYLLAPNDNALRNATIGHVNPNSSWFHDRAFQLILLRRVLAFIFGPDWCSYRRAEHETHAGDSSERCPNE